MEITNVHWVKPSLTGEFSEFPDVERAAEHLEVPVEAIKKAFETGELVSLSDSQWSNLANADSKDKNWDDINEVREWILNRKKLGENVSRDVDALLNAMKEGKDISAPTVLFDAPVEWLDGRPYLVAGNTRLLACRALPLPPIVFAIRLNQEDIADRNQE